MSSLSDVSILLKTFLRDDKLFNSIAAIRKNMPEAQMIIVDDGEQTEEKDGIYADLVREGHEVIILDFDSGFGKKSNAGIEALVRPFLLISSDDFNHNPPSVKMGIEKMLAVLDEVSQLSIVSGRLGNRGPYEFDLVEHDGIVREIPCDFDNAIIQIPAALCDITVNYSLIRRSVFWTEGWDTNINGPGWVEKRTNIGFDEEEIIGEGGHGAFFYDIKKAGLKVGYVPGVYIEEQEGRDSDRYRQYRRRANGPSRKCFEKRGIKKYVLGDGRVDYDVLG